MSSRSVFWLVAVAAAAGALLWAWALRWTCDDAFVSFRYAQHLVQGHGLRFNLDPQEPPVEGYSNFLWTLLLALGLWLGCTGERLETWASLLGAGLHAGTVLLLARMAWLVGGGRALVPVAACGYAALHHASSLAPAGLETAMFVLLATAMAQRAWLAAGARDALWLGGLGVLAAMTRPDGAVLAASAGVFVLADAVRGRTLRPVLAFALPFLLGFAPYLLWRHATYGYWVPNTFFAKSGGNPYPGQGLDYVLGFAQCYRWGLLPLLPALLVLPRLGRADGDGARRRFGMVLVAFALPYLGFVVWVGGDFMFARFLLPVLPLLLLAGDVALAGAPRAGLVVAVLVTGGMLLRQEPAWLDDFTQPVSDNRRISVQPMRGFPEVTVEQAWRAAGAQLRQLWQGLPVRIAVAGGQANLAYRTGVPVAIECATGLTDAFIAHLPVAQRGKPGHEKSWRLWPGYLQRRGVHFTFDLDWRSGSIADLVPEIVFPCTPVPAPARIVRYDAALLAELRRREPRLSCFDLPAWLDRDYLPKMKDKPRAQLQQDLRELEEFYFWPDAHGVPQQDPERHARLQAAAEGR